METNTENHIKVREARSYARCIKLGLSTAADHAGVVWTHTWPSVLLSLVPQIWQRSLQGAPERILNSVDKCGEYFAELLSGSRREMLWQVCLDGKGKVLSSRCLAEGDVSMAAVSVRQVVEYALRAGAVAVVLAHNHPSGVALPSQEDCATTRLIRDALRTMNIQLVDHIIVADGDYVSMAASGLLI